MALSIGILGTLVIERDDCRLGKVPKKARALLGYLAAQGGQAVSRERLADLLWPYQGSEQARHSLRNCLLELRKALGPSAVRYLVADFANCRIEDAVVDLDRFERLSRSPQQAELQPAAGLDGGIGFAGGILRRGQALQDLTNQRQRAVALGRQPFLKGLRVDIEIGQKLAAVQLSRRLQLGLLRRPRQSLEAVQVNHRVFDAAIGKVGNQVTRPVRPERLAQLQQAVAQAVPRLFGALVRPQQIGQPLTTDRLPALRRQITKQCPRLLGHLPKPTIVPLDHQ